MLDSIKQVLQDAKNRKVENSKDLEDFRLRFLSKKGVINELFEDFKKVSKEQKKEFGQELNKLKGFVEGRF
ncbi:MAG: phenylalanyl-tRNA synthetase alpha chain, partial [Arcticibacterium sp.]